jgi:N-acetyl sugar amidotransferase
MKTCKRCLYPQNHPLHLVFDQQGICSGCRVHEEKDNLDWQPRAEKLKKILENFRNRSANNYDCIIPVSGARDSYFIVHTIKNVYKMNPLLVTYNKQYNTDLGIRNLANLRARFDCDIITLTVNPETVKQITRATMRKIGSIYWHCIAGQTVFPVQTAVRFKIPLIVWGAHQGLDQVGMFSHSDEVEMTRKYRKEHDLMGYEAEGLVDQFDSLTENEMKQFIYPDDKELEKVGVRGIYLNNYLRWDSISQHREMIKLYDYENAPQTRTFDVFNDVDCFNYSDVHDYIKFLKFGYSRVTDHATREIRLGKMTREQGIGLVRKYTAIAPKNLRLFLDWIGMTENSFHYIIDQHRSKEIWKRNENWQWEMVHNTISESVNPSEQFVPYPLTEPKRKDYTDNKYILIGKGKY